MDLLANDEFGWTLDFSFTACEAKAERSIGRDEYFESNKHDDLLLINIQVPRYRTNNRVILTVHSKDNENEPTKSLSSSYNGRIRKL